MTPLFPSSTYWQAASGQPNSSSCFRIRAAQPGDLTGLAELVADSFHSQDGILGWTYPLLRLGIYEDLRNRLRLASPHYICLVAVPTVPSATGGQPGSTSNGELAGTVELTLRSPNPWADERYRYPYVSNLAVCPNYRRQGVAGQMLLSCERVALSWGLQDLYLHVLENNYQARQLYFKMGYRLHQVDFSWSTLLLGRPRQLFLRKRLNTT